MLIEKSDQVSAEWLSGVLGETVSHVEITSTASSWASHAGIVAATASGRALRLWLKMCLGKTFGRSEVDFYTRDYVGLANAPLVPCFDACFVPGVGYHLLLTDLSERFRDRKIAEPTLEHGLAIAAALALMHQHHWETAAPPNESQWNRYFDQIRPGVLPLERATDRSFRHRFELHTKELLNRWHDPQGMTLLHGDLNPTNVLTPKGAESPVYFLDRQPFEWSLTYGLAVYDLAYALVPWWPDTFRTLHEQTILRHWFERLNQHGYSWDQAQRDWSLSVEQCLHVPFEWCSDPETEVSMRPLWQWQLGNITGILNYYEPHSP